MNEHVKVDDEYSNRFKLPVYNKKQDILKALKHNNVVIISGETGSGKTTQIPQFVFDYFGKQKNNYLVGVTQPRRVAAITVAKRVALERKTKLGKEIGYSVRFDDNYNVKETKIKFLTDGMLLRESMIDSLLSKYNCIILDEAHERSIRTDVLFGIMKRALQMRKKFKCIVMSATLEIELFQNFFNLSNKAIITIPGRQYPVDVFYSKEDQLDRIDGVITSVLQIHIENDKEDGDILVFLTGQDEIDECCSILEKKGKGLKQYKKLIIKPLYAALSNEQQLEVFKQTPNGCRKVILSTNIAETSVTVSGVRFVIDTGYCKERVYNSSTGLKSLDVVRISKAQSWQRAGRAGREAAGFCYRLYSEPTFKDIFLDRSIPEIKRIDLSEVVLQLLSLGIKNIKLFDFLEPPAKGAFQDAFDKLLSLGAIDKKTETLTKIGKAMASLPLDPTSGRLLLQSLAEKEYSKNLASSTVNEDINPCVDDMLSLVSMLSVEPPFLQSRNYSDDEDKIHDKLITAQRKLVSELGDHVTLINVFKSFMVEMNKLKSKPSDVLKWCKLNYVKYRTLSKALKVKKQLTEILLQLLNRKQFSTNNKKNHDYKDLLQCLTIVYGIEGKIAWKISKDILNKRRKLSFLNDSETNKKFGKYYTVSNNSKIEVSIHPSSTMFGSHTKHPEYVLYDEIMITNKQYIKGVSKIDKEWLVNLLPGVFVIKDEVSKPNNRINAHKKRKRLNIGSMVEINN